MRTSQPAPTGPVDLDEVRRKIVASGYDRLQDSNQMLIGTPETVIAKAKIIMETLRPGMLIFFAVQGPVSHEDRRRSLELTAKNVLPEIRAHADKLGLPSPFDRAPGSVSLAPGQTRAAVVDRSALPEA